MAYINGKDDFLVALKGEKGDTGAKIVSTVLIGQDENGGNIYKQTFDDGTTAEFVAPKGDKGGMVASVSGETLLLTPQGASVSGETLILTT